MVNEEIYNQRYDVIVIGGGATGAGTARDCAMRGLKVLLVNLRKDCAVIPNTAPHLMRGINDGVKYDPAKDLIALYGEDRILFGTDHKRLLPLSALLGAVFLIWADVACRVVIPRSELPLGILVSAIGAPSFVWLLVRKSYGFGEGRS